MAPLGPPGPAGPAGPPGAPGTPGPPGPEGRGRSRTPDKGPRPRTADDPMDTSSVRPETRHTPLFSGGSDDPMQTDPIPAHPTPAGQPTEMGPTRDERLHEAEMNAMRGKLFELEQQQVRMQKEAEMAFDLPQAQLWDKYKVNSVYNLNSGLESETGRTIAQANAHFAELT